ncbi:MAG: hypothetical protein D6772_04690 [Bacteroidetes bacterium]|nr:MAG: hypothetical protein D6772_04690 [Bacteroidota bacterium]
MMTNKIRALSVPITLDNMLERRARLEQEANLALSLLEHKAKDTLQKGKNKLADKLSLSTALMGLAAIGVPYLLGKAATSSSLPAPTEPVNWPVEIQRGFHHYQHRPHRKWAAFLPLLLKIIDKYLSR